MLRWLVFCLLSLPVIAEDLVIFPGANEFERSSVNDQRFDLAIGGMQKKNGVWQPEYTKRVNVSGQRITLEIGRGVDLEEVYAFYEDYFKARVVKQLYSCKALDCGSSAQWANGYFGVRELYGEDIRQHLTVWLLNDAPQQIVTFYLIQRGNKRVYAHFDVLDLKSPLTEEQRRVKVVQDVFGVVEQQTDELRDLARLIRDSQQSGYRIILVGHSYQGSDQPSNQSAGLELAQQLRERLQFLGLNKLSVESAGMFAPMGDNPSDRVSVIAVLN